MLASLVPDTMTEDELIAVFEALATPEASVKVTSALASDIFPKTNTSAESAMVSFLIMALAQA
jgi:hypothetical protein